MITFLSNSCVWLHCYSTECEMSFRWHSHSVFMERHLVVFVTMQPETELFQFRWLFIHLPFVFWVIIRVYILLFNVSLCLSRFDHLAHLISVFNVAGVLFLLAYSGLMFLLGSYAPVALVSGMQSSSLTSLIASKVRSCLSSSIPELFYAS